MKLYDINTPIGSFVIENASGVQAGDGRYFHYQEVCALLKKYEQVLANGDQVFGQADGRNENRVVKITRDDDGRKKDSPKWCLAWDAGGTDVAFCTGEAFGFGESIAQYKEKQGRITCPECRKKIKALKQVKL